MIGYSGNGLDDEALERLVVTLQGLTGLRRLSLPYASHLPRVMMCWWPVTDTIMQTCAHADTSAIEAPVLELCPRI